MTKRKWGLVKYLFCCIDRILNSKVIVIISRNNIVFPSFFLILSAFSFFQVMVDESLLSDDPDSYVTLTVVRSPGGKGAVRLQWTVDEMAKDDLSPLNGTLHFDEVCSASGPLQFFSNLSLFAFPFHSLTYEFF